MTVIEFLKDWFIPVFSATVSIMSLGLAIWFASSAKNDATKAQTTLDQVHKAIEGWQAQIMSSTVEILDSTPQVVQGKTALAKMEAAKMLADGIQSAIHEIVKNPQGGATGHTQEQNLKILTEQLHTLLEGMSKSSQT